MKKDIKLFLEDVAYQLRRDSVRATTAAGSGHPTSSLSAADLVAVLFFYGMDYDPENPHNPNNDRFILSKGHASPVLYAAWKAVGVISDAELLSLRDFNSVLEGHPTPRFEYVDVATGSLGMGLSIGVGMALSAKKDHLTYRTYVLLGDSEVAEGSIWEAAELGAYYKLDNLIGLIDCNGLGQRGETMRADVQNYADKFAAFGWHTIIIDGHQITQIAQALDTARTITKKPVMIIAKTIKGYGIKSVEGKNGYHGKAFTKEQMGSILQELKDRFEPHEPVKEFMPNEPEKAEGIFTAQLCKPLKQPRYKVDDMLATRVAYGQALQALGATCPKVVSLDGEVSNSTYTYLFAEKYPERFVECFIAEQNMVGMGMGFAARGFTPFIATFGAFYTRALDQIRMAAVSRLPLRLVGSHAGVSIGEDGPSQMALEDIAIMRVIPNSVVFYPCDAVSTYQLVNIMCDYNDGISYLRTTRGKTQIIYDNMKEFHVGGCHVIREGQESQALIIGAGVTLYEALKAHELLKLDGIETMVIDLYSIKPLDAETILSCARRSGNRIVTVEDHYLEGGLGQAVVYAMRNHDITIDCLAVTKIPHSGSPEQLISYEKIDAVAILDAVKKIIYTDRV
ncbi:transketolase [candidate division TM6 bacterium RIFCSPHIGHO2_12_FULL_36_22]|nr:MAG: transketolase [candidate division TM6 bacterium RIFCSPHIGHO2_12_FULL_36_22]